jgi:hypothetical protein
MTADQDLAALAAYLNIDGNDPLRPALARIAPRLRAFVRRMAEIEAELDCLEFRTRGARAELVASATSCRA